MIEQERFEAWLFNQPRDRMIEPAHGDRCFLCSFIKETTNLKNAGFTWLYYWDDVAVTKPTGPIPEWAARFVNAHDLGNDFPHPDWNPETGNYFKWEISIGQMQDRYIRLFGDPRTKVKYEIHHDASDLHRLQLQS